MKRPATDRESALDVRRLRRQALGCVAVLLSLAVLTVAALANLDFAGVSVTDMRLLGIAGTSAILLVPVAALGMYRLLDPLTGRMLVHTDLLEAKLRETGELLRRTIEESSRRLEAERARRASDARYRTLVEATQTLVWFTNAEGLVVDSLPSWAAFTGTTESQCMGWGWLESVHPQDREHVSEVWRAALATRSTYECNYRLRGVDGRYHFMVARGVPVLDEHGDIVEWIGSCHDLQALKDAEDELRRLNARLEARVRERTAQFERSNAELEQFAYAASHDLKSPMRSIASFASLLKRRYGELLPEEALEFIEIIRESAVQGNMLVDDLMELSRVRIELPPPPAPVDLVELMRSVVQELEPDIEARGAEVLCGELPQVQGDAGQLRQLLRNLISNGLKFQPPPLRSPGHRPRVEVCAEHVDGGWRVQVRDNGIGIEQDRAEGIFRLLRRLHTREEYPGSGVGLALCQKIVLRHGGRIWVESKLGQGTIFYFTLPGAVGRTTPQAAEAVVAF